MIKKREQTVLKQVITLHYRTCEPVGSGLICKTKALPYSSATIRNIMVELEQHGLLQQPHKSAGRLPTDMGYRSYVTDMRLDFTPLGTLDQKALASEIEKTDQRMNVLRTLSEYLIRRTKLISFYAPFKHSGLKLKRMVLERISDDRLLAVPISRNGQTFQHVIPQRQSVMNDQLIDKVQQFINREFAGKNLIDIRRRLTAHSQRSSGHTDFMVGMVSRIFKSLEQEWAEPNDLKFLGFDNMFDMPEFDSLPKIRNLYLMLHHSKRLKDLIRKCWDQKNDQILIYIGSELEDSTMKDITIYLTLVNNQDDVLGCIGIMGPKRMPYLTALQLLSYIKHKMSHQIFD